MYNHKYEIRSNPDNTYDAYYAIDHGWFDAWIWGYNWYSLGKGSYERCEKLIADHKQQEIDREKRYAEIKERQSKQHVVYRE